MREIADNAYEQVRGTLADLHPSGPVELSKAILENARQVGRRANFLVRMDVEGEVYTLPSHVNRQVLYLCQIEKKNGYFNR